MRLSTLGVAAAALAFSLATPIAAKTPLRDVAKIDNALMAVAIADALRKSCDEIDARLVRAYSTLNTLKREARALGYSDDEIDDYVTSKSEKARMKAKAEAWLAQQGVRVSDTAAFCAFGQEQIASGTSIGRLLK